MSRYSSIVTLSLKPVYDPQSIAKGRSCLWKKFNHDFNYIFCSREFIHRTQSNAIHWIVSDWVRLPNQIENNLMDWIRFRSICLVEFDWLGNRTHTNFGVRFGSIAGLNRTQFTDWVRFPNVRLLAIPVVCLVSSKVSISVGSSNPKLYMIPMMMTTDIAEAAHTNHDHKLSGRHVGSWFSSCTLRAFSPLLLLKHLAMTPENA